MKLAWAALISTTALAGSAWAQPRPAPPRPSPSPSPGASPEATQSAPRPPRWAFRLRAQESYDSNVEFTEAEGPGSFEDQVGGGLTLRLAGRRGELTLSGDGWGRRYHSVEGVDGFNYTAGLSGSHRFSPRVTGRMRGTFGDNITRVERQLTDAGLQLPLTRTQTVDALGGLVFGLGARTNLTVEGRFERATFDAPELVNGQQWSGAASLAQALSATHRVSLNYTVRTIRREDVDRRVHDVFGGWSRTLSRRFNMDLLGGVSFRPVVGDLEERTDFYGSAALSYGFQHGLLLGRYTHSLGEAYGLGRERVADVVLTALSRRFGRRVDWSLGGSWGASRDPADPTFRYRALSASTGLGVLLSRELRLSANYGLSRSVERAGDVPVLSHFGSLSLAYEVEWQ